MHKEASSISHSPKMSRKRHSELIHRGLLLLATIVLCSCGGGMGERTRYLPENDIRARDSTAFGLQTTGTACDNNPGDASRAAISLAKFNLRSVVGDKRYHVDIEEVDRYQDGLQWCIKIQASARKP